MNDEQIQKMREGDGFIAALDQSGGSTPKALKLYGISEDSYSGDDQMFDLIHEMRARIIKSAAFNGDRILGAILFEKTMDRQIDGLDTGDYLWSKKNVVPILKIDKGLDAEADGVQLMKPMPDLDELLERGVRRNMFGTKERSVIKLADPKGVEAIAAQQFEVGAQVLSHGLVPILEPEIDIHSPEKAKAEELLKAARERLAKVEEDAKEDPVKRQVTVALRQFTAVERRLEGAKKLAELVGKPAAPLAEEIKAWLNGEPLKEADLKGKVVLLDFWASWCRPCRMENPNVVKVFNKFKSKNFTVLGVSLDMQKDAWVKAIEKDNLTWTHVSDLKYWNSAAAQLYNVRSIPFNVLLDPSGKIVAENLRGPDLTRKLQELLP